jgi:hypothetical protein
LEGANSINLTSKEESRDMFAQSVGCTPVGGCLSGVATWHTCPVVQMPLAVLGGIKITCQST